ncbi:MAG: NADPH-dependent F420 reductase [Proteobacteria bacterium]|nr:NADPH-dependent F420 reductase [Pseudomonadota bacterium]
MTQIALIGGTGKEGRGLALRWARAGHDVAVGSRDAKRGEACAAELSERSGKPIVGGGNEQVLRSAEIAILSVPYNAHQATLTGLRHALAGTILIDITVPLAPPRVRQVHLPAGQAAALEARQILGDDVRLAAALHHVSSVHLADVDHPIDCDVLVCADDDDTRASSMALISDLGVRAIDAGPLRNAIALESLTPVLLYLNRRYKSSGCGIHITGIRAGNVT